LQPLFKRHFSELSDTSEQDIYAIGFASRRCLLTGIDQNTGNSYQWGSSFLLEPAGIYIIYIPTIITYYY
jgi:hypothetical protein